MAGKRSRKGSRKSSRRVYGRVSGPVRDASTKQRDHMRRVHRKRRYETVLKDKHEMKAAAAEKLAYQLAFGKAATRTKYGSVIAEVNKPKALRIADKKLAERLSREYNQMFPHRVKLGKKQSERVKEMRASRKASKATTGSRRSRRRTRRSRTRRSR